MMVGSLAFTREIHDHLLIRNTNACKAFAEKLKTKQIQSKCPTTDDEDSYGFFLFGFIRAMPHDPRLEDDFASRFNFRGTLALRGALVGIQFHLAQSNTIRRDFHQLIFTDEFNGLVERHHSGRTQCDSGIRG